MKASELRQRPVRTLHTNRGGEIKTYLTDAECLAVLLANRPNLSSFGASLLEQSSRRPLSANQWPWAHNLALDFLPASAKPGYEGTYPKPQPVAATTIEFGAVRSLLEAAQANGIKFPKVSFGLDLGWLVIALAGAKSKAPGSIAVTSKGSFEERTYYGRIHLDGRWEAARGGCPAWVLEALTGLAENPAGFSAAYGRRTGNCCFCSRELTTKESLHVGYGPVCADKYGLPWGDVPEPTTPAPRKGRKATLTGTDRMPEEAGQAFEAAKRPAGEPQPASVAAALTDALGAEEEGLPLMLAKNLDKRLRGGPDRMLTQVELEVFRAATPEGFTFTRKRTVPSHFVPDEELTPFERMGYYPKPRESQAVAPSLEATVVIDRKRRTKIARARAKQATQPRAR